jgi:hypothetical protein
VVADRLARQAVVGPDGEELPGAVIDPGGITARVQL